MAWLLADAITSLRIRLSDAPTDKYLHQMPVDPPPDGIHRVFAVPNSRIVPTTLKVYLDGELITPDSVDEERGSFEISAPDTGQQLVASYYFQWFNDADLIQFLQDGAQLLHFTGVQDTAVTVPMRTPLLSFAAYYAYLKKAAESAVPTQASSAGFSADTSQEHPYWMNLAKQAWEAGQQELETVNTNPVSAVRPKMTFVSYRMARYVPRS